MSGTRDPPIANGRRGCVTAVTIRECLGRLVRCAFPPARGWQD